MKPGRFKNATLAGLMGLALLFALSPRVLAASAEWSMQDKRAGRERIVLRLEGAGAPVSVARNGLQSVELIWPELLKALPAGIAVAPPPEALLFDGLEPSANGLLLKVKNASFGFISTRPDKDTLQIDLFNNPLGARWTPPASAPPPDSREVTQTAAPESRAPVVSSTPSGQQAQPEKTQPARPNEEAPVTVPAGEVRQPSTVQTEPAHSVPAQSAPLQSAPARLVPVQAGQSAQPGQATGGDDGAVDAPQAEISAGPSVGEQPEPDFIPPYGGAAPANPPFPSGLGQAGAGQAGLPSDGDGTSGAPANPLYGGSGGGAELPGFIGNGDNAVRGGRNTFSSPMPSPDDTEEEAFPVWPPLHMPDKLPNPPAPPDAGQSSGQFFIKQGQPYLASSAAPRGLSPADWLPFTARTAYAAEPLRPADGYEVIDAPFIYKGRLVKDGPKPSPEEGRIPVMVRVPTSNAARYDESGSAKDAPASGSSKDAPASGSAKDAPASVPAPGQTQAPETPPEVRAPQGSQTSQAQPAFPAAQMPEAPSPAPTPSAPAGAPSGRSVQTVTPEQSEQPVQPAGPADAAPSQPSVKPSVESPVESSGQPSGQSTAETSPSTQPPARQQPQAQPQPQASGQPQPAGQPQNPVSPPANGGSPYPSQPAAPENVVYVDEEGNPVEPPLDPKVATFDLQRFMSNAEYSQAYALADKVLKQGNLSREQRELFLHRRADALFSLHRAQPEAVFNEIIDTTTSAVNFNTRSPRNAGAYLRLGYLNLKAKNAYEAEAYFTLLRQQFPKDESVPLSFYYMGDYQYEQGNLNDAALQFLHVVQEYPDSRYSRDAALGLTRTLYRQGYYEKAYEVIDYVEKRWPRFYLDYPPVLSMLGDTAYRAKEIERARQAYWLYYNLLPNAPDADIILSRLGDIYQSQKFRSAATHVYEEAARRFPSKDGGIVAMMRLAENGINDEPTLASMFKVFQQPYNLRPAEAYRKIIRDYPDSPLVPLAKLKLAMWSVWQKDFESAFRLSNEVVMADPNHPLAAKAIEVSRNAFALLAAESVNTKRYDRVRDAWSRYPMLHTQEEFLDPESRLALAVSQWEGANPDLALETVEPFFLGAKIPEYSEMALILGLTILVNYDRWEEVEELAQRVELWELTPETKNQMDYALGLAYENMGKSRQAMPLWKNLYEHNALPPEQQAYADFYLARQAEKDRDLESAYRIGRDALQRLKDLAALSPEQADTEKIKTLLSSLMDISQSGGQIQDALDYGAEYLQYADSGSDDYLSVLYSMASLHRRRGSMGEWEKLLEELSRNYPQTYYGKAAASQLSGYRMNRNAAQFSPTGNF